MKNKKLKIVGFFSLLMLAYVIHSCKKDDEFFEKHAPNPTRRIERINKREMERAINSAWKQADSVARVMTIQHFDSLNNTK